MKNLYNENRIARLLQYFRTIPVITVSTLAEKLEVSERTIRNDIKQLNQELGSFASIEGSKGKYSLHIYSNDGFKVIYAKIVETDEFLNSVKSRIDYIFSKLIRSEEPVITDELAYEMNVGRTTMLSDLKRLREELEPYQLSIVGKAGSGLLLHGAEWNIRKYILEHNYPQLYKDYPLDSEIKEIIQANFASYALENTVRHKFEEFVTLMLDRFLTGHYIGTLEVDMYKLGSKDEFVIVDELLTKISQLLQVEFPLEEKIFTFLPILGMRTPTDLTNLQSIKLDVSMQLVLEKIVERIRQKMNINLANNEFTKEFLYHMMFLRNRLRYGIKLVNPMLDDLKNKYPLAYQMAGVAAEIIEEEYGFKVSEDEQGYLAAYFCVFLAENNVQSEKKFRIALVCGTGRVTARLVAIQLKKIMDSDVVMDTLSQDKATMEKLDGYDIVVTTIKLDVPCSRPVIQVNEIFDEQELYHKIEKAKYWDQIEVPMLDNNRFVMTGFLSKNRVFFLNKTTSYEEAVQTMADSMMAKGYLDENFADRLMAREKKGTMVFGNSIAIPHTTQLASDRMVFAVGVSDKPLPYLDYGVQVIFLIGIPENIDEDDGILIRLYDEIISIAKNENMLQSIAKAKKFQEILSVLYKNAEKR